MIANCWRRKNHCRIPEDIAAEIEEALENGIDEPYVTLAEDPSEAKPRGAIERAAIGCGAGSGKSFDAPGSPPYASASAAEVAGLIRVPAKVLVRSVCPGKVSLAAKAVVNAPVAREAAPREAVSG